MPNTVYLRRFYPQIHADERRLNKAQQSFWKLVILKTAMEHREGAQTAGVQRISIAPQ